MKKILYSIFFAFSFAVYSAAAPQAVIFDTDMGNDIDDALAQAMLLNYEKSGKVKIRAIVVNKDNPYSPLFVKAINDYYSRSDIPVGFIRNGATKKEGPFIGKVCRDMGLKPEEFPDSVKLLRKILSESDDGEIVYISVGFSTNIERLLKSEGDSFSPLSGRELFRKKVKYLSVMAGDFEHIKKNSANPHCEYNITCDIPAAKYVFENPPVPVVFSGFEIGRDIRFPSEALYRNLSKENPIVAAYQLHSLSVTGGKSKNNNRESWDLTSVLYVVSPGSFGISERGNVEVTPKGATLFKSDKSGMCQFLTADSNQGKEILQRLIEGVSGSK